MVKWAELPEELLLSTSKRLDSEIDFTRFRSVSKSWRFSVPPRLQNSSPELPLRLPVWVSPGDRSNSDIPGYFILTLSTIYRLEPPHEADHASSSSSPKSTSWLLKLQEVRPGKMRLLPMLAAYQMCPPPETFPKVIHLSNFRVSVPSKAYNIRYEADEPVTLYFYGDYYSLEADKVVVSSNGAGDTAVMAIHSGGKLGFWRAGDEKWTVLDDILTRYEDIIGYDGGFCAVDWEGKALAIDFNFRPSEIPQVPGRGDKKHLVERKSTGDLLLVDRYLRGVWGEDFSACTKLMKVYKLNKEMQRWEELKSLGNESLFLGEDCSFSLATQDFPGLRGNCIFYKDPCFRRNNNNSDALKEFLSDDIGVFNLEDNSIRPLAAYPGLCSLFWPPPDLGLKLCFQDHHPGHCVSRK